MGSNTPKVLEESSSSLGTTNWSLSPTIPLDLLDMSENWTVFTLSPDNSSTNDTQNRTLVGSFKRDEELAKVEMAVLALLFILTVLGNSVVLLGIFFRRQKMTRMYYFILHLSVADLITAFFNVLTQLFWEITYRFKGGNILCKFVKYTQILGPYSSSYVLVMTALDRYQAICYPLSNCTWTARRSKVMLALAWSISFLCCVPQIFIFSYQLVQGTDPPEFDCWATFPDVWVAKAYVTWYSITVFIIPLVVLVFAYSCITRTIWINFNMKAAARNHDNYERHPSRPDSDEGDGPSGSGGMDESVFQREDHNGSVKGNPSQSISTGNKKSINLSAAKNFLAIKASTSGGDSSEGRGKSNVNRNRASTSSCHTQSSRSPSLSSRRMSEDHKKMSFEGHHREEQVQLIESGGPCQNEFGSRAEMKNGSVKFSRTPDTCQHGCFRKQCNFCTLSHAPGELRRYSTSGTITDGTLNKDLTKPETSKRFSSESGSDGNHQNSRFSAKSTSRHLLLPSSSSRWRKASRGGKQSTIKSLTATSVNLSEQQPRTHSVKGISRAKIKTIKLTVTVICCYIFCSSPFIAAQLWSVYDPEASNSSFFTGPTFTILTLLASLNSCVNPYIFLLFNPNLLQNCFRGIFRPKFPTRRFHSGGSPLSRTLSQNRNKGHLITNGKGGDGGSETRRGGPTRVAKGEGSLKRGTSASNLAPLISREGPKSYQLPLNNGIGKGYSGKAPNSEKPTTNNVELQSQQSTATTCSMDSYSRHLGAQPCRVETALVGSQQRHSTLII